MSETVNKTLLTGSGDSGFSLISQTNFDSTSVNPALYAEDSEALPVEDPTAVFRQGSTYNKYSDWGVPAGARILGIKLLGASGSLSGGATASGNVNFYTTEAFLGTFDINSIGEGTYQDISAENLTADDYVQVEVSFDCTIEFDEGGYTSLTAQVSNIQFEITYQRGNKGAMFFGAF